MRVRGHNRTGHAAFMHALGIAATHPPRTFNVSARQLVSLLSAAIWFHTRF